MSSLTKYIYDRKRVQHQHIEIMIHI